MMTAVDSHDLAHPSRSAAPAAWRCGSVVFDLRRPLIMGILNVTPDSFSDGGLFLDPARAREQGQRLIDEGADIIDVGGESTRPGAAEVTADDELRRVLPAVEALAQMGATVSIDTSRAEVMRAALDAGATIVNDVRALQLPGAIEAVATRACGIVVMHMQGTPQTMQLDPTYQDVVRDLHVWFEERLAALAEAGIDAERVALDPGIGFGKRLEHNLELLARGGEFLDLGRPICLGVSRKGFINRVLGEGGWVEQGTSGTIGVLLQAMAHGCVHIARVHDVRRVKEAMTLFAELEARARRRQGPEREA
jgi:dihydropteroate synthase